MAAFCTWSCSGMFLEMIYCLRAEDINWSVNFLPYKCKKQCSDPDTHVKAKHGDAGLQHWCQGKAETCRSLEFTGQPLQMNQWYLGSVREPTSRNKVENIRGRHLTSTFGLHMHIFIHIHMHTHVHTHKHILNFLKENMPYLVICCLQASSGIHQHILELHWRTEWRPSHPPMEP